MASASKSVTLTAPAGGSVQYRLTASFNENSTSVNNNTSNITCTATISSLNSSGWSSSYNSTLTIYWHDNRENTDKQVASVSFSSLGSGTTKSASGNKTVTHNNDGNLSGYAYAKFTKGGTSSYTPATSGVTTSWTALTKIDRFATMTAASSFNDTQNPSFTYSNPRNLTMSAWLEINPTGTHYAERTISGSTSGTYTWELTEEERNQLRGEIPNSKTGTCRIGIYSTIGSSTQASYKDVTYTIIDGNPTFDVAYLDTNSTTTAITQNNQELIRDNSTLQINVTNAIALKEASLSSVVASINGVNYTATLNNGSATFNIGTLNIASDTEAVITLTDTRGFTTSHTLNLKILNWELPTGIIGLQRQSNYYSNTDINVDANCSSLDGNNTITIKTRYKKVVDSTYGNYVTLQDNVTTTLTLDNEYQWDVQVLIEDRLGSTTYNLTLDRGIPIVYFDRTKRSVGINCFPSSDTSLELNGIPVGNGETIPIGTEVDYDGNIVPSGWQEINSYSTTEITTGQEWIDGKPIYRRVFVVGSVAVGSVSTLGTISNLDTAISFDGALYDNGLWFPIARVHRSNVIYQTQIYMTNNAVTIANGSSSRVEKGYVIVEYTKTTD